MALNRANGHLKVSVNPSGRIYLSMHYPLRATILDSTSKPDGDFSAGFSWIMYQRGTKDEVRICH